MPPATKRRNLQDPQQILEALESFLTAARSPALIESGRPAITVDHDRIRLDVSVCGVVLEIWGPEGTAVRRVTSITSHSRTKLELQAARFAGADIRLALVDSAARSTVGSTVGHSSEAFLQRLLSREFPGSRVSRMSGSSDLQNSLSGRHVRCLMHEKKVAWAVAAAPPLSSADASNSTITTGLLWLRLLRKRNPRQPVIGLRLLLPLGRETRTARLLRFLDAEIAAYELYVYDLSGSVRKVELSDAGNQESRLGPHRATVELGKPLQDWVERLEALDQVETVIQANGVRSMRVWGFEFATIQRHQMHFGLETSVPVTTANFSQVIQFAQELATFRNPRAKTRSHPLYRALPERWLESQLRRHIAALDPSLGHNPIFGQSIATQGIDRGIIDLLTLDQSGRLVIIEVKETSSLQLPIQSLDYWTQVVGQIQTHPESIQRLFPAQRISRSSPRLLLIAPSLGFHPTTEHLL